MTWTSFRDVHSGGSSKEDFKFCFIEAAEDEAKVIFYNRFDHSPDRVSCTCCGSDYSVYEYDTLEDATHYERIGKHTKVIALDDFVAQKDVQVIRAEEIKSEERTGVVPRQGYVWVE